MRRFRNIPIRQKLAIIIMITTTAALVCAGVGIVIADSILFRGYLRRDLSTLARIVADNSTAALAFNDSDVAAQTLGALRERPHVVGACLYRLDGTVLATYSAENRFHCPPPGNGDAVRFDSRHLTVWQTVLLSGRPVGNLILIYDLGEIGERGRIYGGAVLALLLASGLVALLLSARLRSVIATPISHLVSASTAVAETGDYSIRAQKLSDDELGVLVDRFNEMLGGIQSRDNDLKEALREVERERQRFHFMAESMPQKIFTATPSGEVDYMNRQWVEYTGLPFDEMKNWGWTKFVHPDDLEPSLLIWRQSLASGAPLRLEQRFRRSDGKYRWHLSRVQAMRDAGGQITMWIGSNTDIHEQKEREEELRRANEDLRQFAYSASHDLQEPIRNVAVYSELVARRYAAVLDSEGLQFLEFLREGGRRLARLVSDLLAYTTASMAELSDAPVDSSAVLQSALASLAEAIRENQATVTYDALPKIGMGAAHLYQVFQNLIGNALKYRGPDPPCIHVSAARADEVWRFSVKDNGIGIDPQYSEKIFGLFKRLHHDRTLSGTGIGLAICQRVVERYGGRIWVESEPGKGATFHFTVPDAQSVSFATVQSSGG